MSETGRVAAFFGPGKLFEIVEYAVPHPGPGAIVVRVSLCNICGSDVHVWHGDVDLEKSGALFPLCIGHEMVGRVHALGEGITVDGCGEPLKEGDRVTYRYFLSCGHCRACVRGQTRACPSNSKWLLTSCTSYPHFLGGFGDYVYLHPGASVFKVPATVDDGVAAGANCALAQVTEGFFQAGLTWGDNVVIQGAGGLGIYATAVARDMGAASVIVIDSVPERLQLAREFGADHVLDLNDLTKPEERYAAIMDLTDGWGADVVTELTGSQAAIPEGINLMGNGGRYVLIGAVTSGTCEIVPRQVIGQNKTVLGVMLYEPETLRRTLEFLERTRDRFPFDRIVSHTFPLDQIDDAFERADLHRAQGSAATRATVSMLN